MNDENAGATRHLPRPRLVVAARPVRAFARPRSRPCSRARALRSGSRVSRPAPPSHASVAVVVPAGICRGWETLWSIRAALLAHPPFYMPMGRTVHQSDAVNRTLDRIW
jgi:hypothetical protein